MLKLFIHKGFGLFFEVKRIFTTLYNYIFFYLTLLSIYSHQISLIFSASGRAGITSHHITNKRLLKWWSKWRNMWSKWRNNPVKCGVNGANGGVNGASVFQTPLFYW